MAGMQSGQLAGLQDQQQQQRSSGLSLNLSSNNPFRNRAVSPSLASPLSPFDDPPTRPMSRNPFLDPAVSGKTSAPELISLATTTSMTSTSDRGPKSPTAEELFDSLTLDDKSNKKSPPPGQMRPDAKSRGPSGGKDGAPPPPGARRGPPPSGHRPTHSQEEALRAKKPQGLGSSSNNNNNSSSSRADGSRSPGRRPERRPRRNSESSVVSSDKPLTDEEKKIREMRRRERERRHRERREHGDKKPVNRKLDIIDQLDATSIYGTGLFHHDGPFDALNPHRNKKGSSRAPMKAFPKDSLNNTIGGAGPLNDRPDHATFMGHNDDEAFKEWSSGAKDRMGPTGYSSKGETPVFDPTSRGVLHGDRSLGLGTSTFLEGTPAARTAIAKHEEERTATGGADGLQRKKSLAQRIRNINRGPRDVGPSGGRLTNPENGYRQLPKDGERNPFFNEFEDSRGDEDFSVLRKTTSNSASGGLASPISPPPPPRRGSAGAGAGPGLERRSTADSVQSVPEDLQSRQLPPPPSSKQPSGLLARVKSLKGGRRTRPAPPGGEDNAQG